MIITGLLYLLWYDLFIIFFYLNLDIFFLNAYELVFFNFFLLLFSIICPLLFDVKFNLILFLFLCLFCILFVIFYYILFFIKLLSHIFNFNRDLIFWIFQYVLFRPNRFNLVLFIIWFFLLGLLFFLSYHWIIFIPIPIFHPFFIILIINSKM